jgi:hypothetical protein
MFEEVPMPPHIVGPSGTRYRTDTVRHIDAALTDLAAKLRPTHQIAEARRRTLQGDADQLLEERMRLVLA